MTTFHDRLQKIAIPLRDLQDILLGRCGVIKDVLPADAKILRVECDIMYGVATMLILSKEFDEVSLGYVIPTETRAFAYFDPKKAFAEAGLEMDISP